MKLRVEGDDVVVDQGQQKQCADGQHDWVVVTSVRSVAEDVAAHLRSVLPGVVTVVAKEVQCVRCGMRKEVFMEGRALTPR